MSQRNVDIIREAYRAFARQDMEALFGSFAPDIAWHTPDSVPWGGTFKGHEELGSFFQGVGEALGELRVEPERYVDGGDTVVVQGHHRGTAPNGHAYDASWIMVWDLEDGKVVRFEEELDSATIVAALA
jgi:ketosteroid isomerase-like protein